MSLDFLDDVVETPRRVYGEQSQHLAESELGTSMYFKDSYLVPRTKVEMDWAVSNKYVIKEFRNREDIDVEMMLDFVDLKLDWYVPSIEAIKFINFIRLCIGKEPENLNSLSHYFLIDCIFKQPNVSPYFKVRNIDYDFLKGSTVILGTREFSKSVLLTYLMLYMADTGKIPNFGKVSFGLYVSDKMEGNVQTTMRLIKSLYKSSAYLQSRFEEVKLTDVKVSFYRKPRSKKDVALYNKHMSVKGNTIDTVPQRMDRKFSITGIGASGGRGSRDDLQRPEFAIFDDLVKNDKDVSSTTIMDAIETTIEKDIKGALHGTNSFKVLIGTAYAEHDPVYSRMTGAWLPCVFPKAEQPPTDELPEDEFISVWEDRHTYEAQRKAYLEAVFNATGKNPLAMLSYLQEFFCRITSNDDRLIPKKYEQWYDVNNVLANSHNFTFVLTTDYTTTGHKTSDDSGAFLWAISHDDQWFLVDMKLRKMELEVQYNNTFDMVDSLDGIADRVLVAVEIDGQQILHIVALKDRQFKRNTFLQFARQKTTDGKPASHIGIRSKDEGGNKFWRFKLTKPKWFGFNIWLPAHLRHSKDMKTFLKELKLTSNSAIKGSDNGLDCTSQLMMVKYDLPSKNPQVNRYQSNYDTIQSDIRSSEHDIREHFNDTDSSTYGRYV